MGRMLKADLEKLVASQEETIHKLENDLDFYEDFYIRHEGEKPKKCELPHIDIENFKIRMLIENFTNEERNKFERYIDEYFRYFA